MKKRLTCILLIPLLLGSALLRSQDNFYLEASKKYDNTSPDVLVTPDGRYIVKLYSRSVLKKEASIFYVFDCKTGRLHNTIIPPEMGEGVHQPKLSSDGKSIIVYQFFPFRILFYDIESGKLIKEIIAKNNLKVLIQLEGIIDDSLFLLKPAYSKFHKLYDFTREDPLVEYGPSPGNVGSIRGGFCENFENVLTLSGTDMLYLWDTKTGQKVDEKKSPIVLWAMRMGADQKHFAITSGQECIFGKIENKSIKLLSTAGSLFRDVLFNEGTNKAYLINKRCLVQYDISTGREISNTRILFNDAQYTGSEENSREQELRHLTNIPGTEFLLITDSHFVTHIFSTKTGKIVAYLFGFDNQDYAVVTPDGRIEGTQGAIENLSWVRGKQKTPLSITYDQMYTPNLLGQVFTNTLEANEIKLEDVVRFTPEVKISSPGAESKTSNAAVTINLNLKANGDEISNVRIYVNDKLVTDETRGMKAVGASASYTVNVLPGVNSIKAVAITKNGYQSAPAEVKVTYSGATAESRLFVLAIGIDKYKNPAYNLNYAVADASAITDRINQSGNGIFKSIFIYSYMNEKARRDSILNGFARIAAGAEPQDAFILFYAGHGVMSEGTAEVPKDFFLALNDVTQLYGRDDLLQSKGISAAELRDLSKKISAQKQVFFLDACQSGAAVETFAMRGAAEEKAILQLARSTGSYMIASTGSDQYATEFKELGHGVFTYAILQGMNCNADGSEKDSKVTIKELEAYLNDQIPSLTEKYHGSVQYPKAWSKGMDFPIGICK